jgi:hypothetical protein
LRSRFRAHSTIAALAAASSDGTSSTESGPMECPRAKDETHCPSSREKNPEAGTCFENSLAFIDPPIPNSAFFLTFPGLLCLSLHSPEHTQQDANNGQKHKYEN